MMPEHIYWEIATNCFSTRGRSATVRCERCGKWAEMTLDVWTAREDYDAWLSAFAREHAHAPPQPFTAEERERIRILGIHRRGALRCGYGGSAR